MGVLSSIIIMNDFNQELLYTMPLLHAAYTNNSLQYCNTLSLKYVMALIIECSCRYTH